MPAAKKKTKVSITSKSKPVNLTASPNLSGINISFIRQIILVVLIGTAVFLVARKYRGQFIAATVNTTPISRFELNQKLVQRYGQAMVDEMINLTLLKNLAKENSITVTADDVQAERQTIKERLGGEEALAATLKQYNMSETDFAARLETILMEKKLSEKLFSSVTVSDSEVEKFYQDNQAVFESQSLDQVRQEIKDNLKQQKLQQEFSDWFKEQKDKTQINTFI